MGGFRRANRGQRPRRFILPTDFELRALFTSVYSLQHSSVSIQHFFMSHILVVEDDTDIAALIAHYLEKAGHRVDRVTSGTDVLPQTAEARRPIW